MNNTISFEEDIKNAINTLTKGGVLLYPTDTIWGVGCDATLCSAVQKIFEIKKRSPFKSMIILVNDLQMIYDYVSEPDYRLLQAMKNAATPTTAIFSNAKNLAKNLINSNGSVAIRFTEEKFCSELISKLKKPIVSTSANISDQPSPHNFSEIDPALFSDVDYVVHYRRDDSDKKNPSQIIRINDKGEIERVR